MNMPGFTAQALALHKEASFTVWLELSKPYR